MGQYNIHRMHLSGMSNVKADTNQLGSMMRDELMLPLAVI